MANKIKVAVLDDYQAFADSIFQTLSPTKYEVVVFHDTLLPYSHAKTSENDKTALVKRLEPFQIICTMRERTPFPRALIERLPSLKLLLTTGTRNLSLDLPAFKDLNIQVAGTVAQSDSTVTHTISLILALSRNLAADDLAVKTGGWQTTTASSLPGKTFGVMGLGRLGVPVARIMNLAFGMKIIAWSSNLTQETADDKAKAVGLPIVDEQGQKTFRVVSKKELMRESDILSLQLVLSDRSRGIVSAEDLELMKPSALLVNTSRGPLIVEEDLLSVLNKGRIRGAALDVFEIEPLPQESPWRTTDWGKNGKSQVLLSPHMGYVERETLDTWYKQQVENIERWQKGEELLHNML